MAAGGWPIAASFPAREGETCPVQVPVAPGAKPPPMNIMLTGPRGAGKTTAAQTTLEMLEADDLAGYFTEPMGDPVDPKGHLMHPMGYPARTIAHVNSAKGPRVGRFRVNVEAFERDGVAALRDAAAGTNIIIMDEIGRFEEHAPNFVAAIHACLDAPAPVLGVLSAHGGSVVEAIAARPDVRLVPVEEASRDLLPAALSSALILETDWRDMFCPWPATGVILAGGEGSRLQSDKGFLEVGGRTMRERVRKALATVCSDVLVAGPDDSAECLGLRAVPDREGYSGPLAGIAGGLVPALDDHVLVCAWDMPFVDAALGLHMLMLAGEEGFDAVAPRTPDGPEPLFAVYGKSCLEAMAQVMAAGGGRPAEVLGRVNTRWVEGPELAVFGDPKVTLMSVNTPEDLARAREIAGE